MPSLRTRSAIRAMRALRDLQVLVLLASLIAGVERKPRGRTPAASPTAQPRIRSAVLETEPLPPSEAASHFAARLAATTVPADVHADLVARAAGFLVIDARSPEAYA